MVPPKLTCGNPLPNAMVLGGEAFEVGLLAELS